MVWNGDNDPQEIITEEEEAGPTDVESEVRHTAEKLIRLARTSAGPVSPWMNMFVPKSEVVLVAQAVVDVLTPCPLGLQYRDGVTCSPSRKSEACHNHEVIAGLRQHAVDADRFEMESRRFRNWTQKLIDVSEYIGTDREDASRWQCAFGCDGYSYESVNGVTTPDGRYQRTPPASHDWHRLGCPVRALAADLGAQP